jgi:hypothetical protein
MERAYRDTGFVLLGLVPLFLLGFWIPYFSGFPNRFDPEITTVVHIHAMFLFSWLSLLIVQPLLIRAGAFAIHLRLGQLSFVLVPLVVISAVAVIWKEATDGIRAGKGPTAAWEAEYLNLTVLFIAALFVWAIAAIRRGDVAEHMRCMICQVFVILPAGLARTLGYWGGMRQSDSQTICLGFIDLGLIVLILYDKSRGRIGRPYVVTLVVHLALEGGWLALGRPI